MDDPGCQRILLITRNLPPLVGGMERLNWHMAAELAKVAEVRVIGPRGSAAGAPDGVIIREVALRPLRRFLWQARKLARREAKNWKPDMVLAGSGLTAPLARSSAQICDARTAVYVHGLDVATKHPVYRAFWRPAIRAMHRVIANSTPTAELCKSIGVQPDKIGIVHPGVDLPEVHGPRTGDVFRQRHDLLNRPLLLSVGRLSERKGLREFVTNALPRIAEVHPDVLLLVVGDAPDDALHAKAQTPPSIQHSAELAGVSRNLKFLGTITDYAELGAVYRAADVHVFPVRQLPGDPEGFGMVAVEAAAHGLPTVGFATGGIVDAVADGQSGYLASPGDYGALAELVVRVLATRGALAQTCTTYARRFAWPHFGHQLAAQLEL